MSHNMKEMKGFAKKTDKDTVTEELEKVQRLLKQQQSATVAAYEAALQDDPELLATLRAARAQGLQATDTTVVNQTLNVLKK